MNLHLNPLNPTPPRANLSNMTFEEQVDLLLQLLHARRNSFFPLDPRYTPRVMYSELVHSRSNILRPTSMRGLVKFFIHSLFFFFYFYFFSYIFKLKKKT